MTRWIALAAAAAIAALAIVGTEKNQTIQAQPRSFDVLVQFQEGAFDNIQFPKKVKIGQEIDIVFPTAYIRLCYVAGGCNQENIRYEMVGPLAEGLEFNEDTRRLSGVIKGNIGDYISMVYRATYPGERVVNAIASSSICCYSIILPLGFEFPLEQYHPINIRQNQQMAPIVLPPAAGGRDPINYELYFSKVEGLEFNPDTRRLSGTPTNEPGVYRLSYQANDVSGKRVTVDLQLWIGRPVAQSLRPAETTLELGRLDRNLIRRGAWVKKSTFVERYTFHVDNPIELTIDLVSSDADPALRLCRIEPDQYFSTDACFSPAYNDDGGAGTDAKLIKVVEKGYYYISPQAFVDKLSYYTLHISSPDLAPITVDIPSAGRIVARRVDDGRIEFAWHVEGGDRVLPRNRYLPARPPTGRWLNSSDIVVENVNLGKINVRVDDDTGRIEFAFTPADGERILPPSRYFPASAAVNRWLHSTRIEWIE